MCACRSYAALGARDTCTIIFGSFNDVPQVYLIDRCLEQDTACEHRDRERAPCVHLSLFILGGMADAVKQKIADIEAEVRAVVHLYVLLGHVAGWAYELHAVCRWPRLKRTRQQRLIWVF